MDNGASSYRRFLTGNDAGLVEIIHTYTDGLTLYLISLTGDPSTAEEAVEETFFRLAAKKPHFNERSSFRTWLYTIGRNAALDLIRRRKRLSDAPIDAYDALSDEEANLAASYIREEERISLHRAMRRLSRDYRQVLWLVYFEELTNADAARVMKKSKRQIENLVSRARKALKNELMKEGFGK